MGFNIDFEIIPFLMFGAFFAFTIFMVYVSFKRIHKQKEKLVEVALALGLNFKDDIESMLSDPSRLPTYSQEEINELRSDYGKRLARFFSGASFSSTFLSGKYNLVEVSVHFETRGGKSKTTYTIVQAFFKEPLACGLRVYREGFFSKVGKTVFKTQDIQIGNQEFDSLFMIKAENEDVVRGFLQKSYVQASFIRLLASLPHILVTDRGITCEESRVITNAEEYRTLLDTLTRTITEIGQ